MVPGLALAAGAIVVALPALVLAWCSALRRREQERQAMERIQRLQRRIDAVLNDGFDRDSRQDFARLLQSASLTTDLQTPRLCLQAGVERQVPEKYRILGQLAGQGLGAGEIAQALSISRAEASQLLSLTSVADRGRPALAPCRTATGRPISA